MKMTRLFLFFGMFVFSLSFAIAGSTCLNINSKTTSGYLSEVPSINSQLSSCTVNIPDKAYSLVGAGNVLVSVKMSSGTTEQFYVTIGSNKVLTGISKGAPSKYTFEVMLSEATMDKILGSGDAVNEILNGVSNGDIQVKANSFMGAIKWFFAKFFLPKPSAPSAPSTTPAPSSYVPPAGPTGKPDNCDGTYPPAHKGYGENKALWDGYTADTDAVCQSQYGKGIPSPCIHNVQLSVEGRPYYLCWYNE